MRKYYSLLLILLCSSIVFPQQITKVGTTAMTFLKIDAGARQIGMGSASVANTEDAMALFWNPAGIARLEKIHTVLSHNRWFADIQLNYLGFAAPIRGIGTIGFHANFLSMDPLPRTTVTFPEGTGETFDASNYSVGLTYARGLTDRFSIGGTVKVVREEIYNSSATGMAFDIGTLFTTGFKGMQLGMSISNYGTKVQMDGRDLLTQVDIDPKRSGNNETINTVLKTEQYDLPLYFRVGLSMDLLRGAANSNLVIAVDAIHPNDDSEYVNVGAEYVYYNMFALRAGYKSLFATDAEEGLSLGAGFKMTVMRYILNMDYAYRDFGRLGDIQMFSIGFLF
jgi:hypothetical protein